MASHPVPFLCGVFNVVGVPLLVGAAVARLACSARSARSARSRRGVFFFLVAWASASACAFLVLWALMLNVNPYPLSMLNKYEVLSAVPPEFRPRHAFVPRGASRDAALSAVA